MGGGIRAVKRDRKIEMSFRSLLNESNCLVPSDWSVQLDQSGSNCFLCADCICHVNDIGLKAIGGCDKLQ